jgi:Flp pilus assembly protein TadB
MTSSGSIALTAAIPAPRSQDLVLAVSFLVFLFIGLLVFRPFARSDRGQRLVGQIERYGPKHAPAPSETGEPKQRQAARTALDWASALLRSLNVEKRLAARLDQGGSTRKPAEWVLIGTAAGLVLAAMLTVLTRSVLLAVPAGALISWLVIRLVISSAISRRRSAFDQQLPDALQFVAGSLRSGFSLQQSVDAVVRENSQPTAAELARALAEVRIGMDLDIALETVAHRMDSNDFRWIVMAIRIHREVGGNLAEVMENTAATMRERAFLRRHVRGLSAEGRLSAYVLIGLPLLVAAWLLFTDAAYLRPLFTTGIGLLMVVGGATLFVLGTLWMRKLVKVEV